MQQNQTETELKTGRVRRTIGVLWYGLRVLIVGLLVIVLVKPEWPAYGDPDTQTLQLVGLRQFDFVNFWIQTVAKKRGDALADQHGALSESDRSQVVRDFVEKSGEIRRKTIELNRVFADPAVADPNAVSAELQTEINQLRSELTELQTLAEPILQEQVRDVLNDLGFGAGSVVFPPVSAHVTPLPAILIVSPRDRIEQVDAVPIQNGILPPDRAELEQEIMQDLQLSAYVTDIGGLGFYPSLIIETGNLVFLADVIAHEWAHHWFTLRPVGINYLSTPAMRTINESAASIIGQEVGLEVIRRHYPELYVPPEPPVQSDDNAAEAEPIPPTPGPEEFDFRREMGVTRVEVDRLLADGKIEEAEAYMEARRQIFVAQGYNLRVLNQAYFAFHGAYADTGGGAAGRDPVGPLVAEVRGLSGSLQDFMQNLASVTSLEDLETLAAELRR